MRLSTRPFGSSNMLALAGLALGFVAGCNANSASGAASCVQGQVGFCPCTGDPSTSPSGIQTCLPDGTYDRCQCGGATATDGMSGSEGSGDTAETESDSQDVTGGPDLCGNGLQEEGECDLDPNVGEVPCPEDCDSGTDTGTSSTTGTDGSSGGVDVCAGVPIYVGNVPAQPSVWQFDGFGPGFTSGTQACIAAGYEGVCTYSQMVEADAQGDFAAEPEGTTYWVHRVVATMFDGALIQPDTRSRCDDWRYSMNDANDGEYATVGAGTLTFSLDADPLPNGPMDAAGLDCGGVARAIPCCNVCEG